MENRVDTASRPVASPGESHARKIVKIVELCGDDYRPRHGDDGPVYPNKRAISISMRVPIAFGGYRSAGVTAKRPSVITRRCGSLSARSKSRMPAGMVSIDLTC